MILIVFFRYFTYKFKTFGGFRGFGVWMSGFGFCSGISYRGRVRVGELKVEVIPLGFWGFCSLITSLNLMQTWNIANRNFFNFNDIKHKTWIGRNISKSNSTQTWKKFQNPNPTLCNPTHHYYILFKFWVFLAF